MSLIPSLMSGILLAGLLIVGVLLPAGVVKSFPARLKSDTLLQIEVFQCRETDINIVADLYGNEELKQTTRIEWHLFDDRMFAVVLLGEQDEVTRLFILGSLGQIITFDSEDEAMNQMGGPCVVAHRLTESNQAI